MEAVPGTGRRAGAGRVRAVGRARTAVGVALAGTLLASGCAAGQKAQTVEQKPTIDGTEVTVGSMDLRGLAIAAPSGNSYPAGSSAQLKVVIANSGQRDDVLTSITSSAIGGWGAYPTSANAADGVGAVQAVTVPAGGRVAYGTPTAPGVLSVTGLTARQYPGTTIRLTFGFTRAGNVSVAVPISLPIGGGSSIIPEPSGSAAG